MSISPFDSRYERDVPSDSSITNLLFGFEGRISRGTYWLSSIAISFVFVCAVMCIALVLGKNSEVMGLVSLLLYIPLIWTSLALQVKRWHDRGYSGWMVLIGFIPIVGPLWSFVEVGLLPGTEGRNEYGAEPT